MVPPPPSTGNRELINRTIYASKHYPAEGGMMLRSEHGRADPICSLLRQPHPARYKDQRIARAVSRQARAGHQPQGRESGASPELQPLTNGTGSIRARVATASAPGKRDFRRVVENNPFNRVSTTAPNRTSYFWTFDAKVNYLRSTTATNVFTRPRPKVALRRSPTGQFPIV